jgi:hypothetical protein
MCGSNSEWDGWPYPLLYYDYDTSPACASAALNAFQATSHSTKMTSPNGLICFTNCLLPMQDGSLVEKDLWIDERRGVVLDPQVSESGSPKGTSFSFNVTAFV